MNNTCAIQSQSNIIVDLQPSTKHADYMLDKDDIIYIR